MRRLTPPPDPDFDHVRGKFGKLDHPDIVAFIAKANSEYYYWDDVRRRPLPVGFSAPAMWTLIKMSRRSNQHVLNLEDAKGHPFHYWLPDQALQTLHLSDRQGGGVLAAASETAVFNEMRDRILIDSLMEEAIATSQIEGAVTTRRVAKELLRSGRAARDKSEQMIVNGYQTIRLLRDRIDRPLSIDLLHEIQESMTQDTLDDPNDAGRFRTEEDRVQVIDTRDGEIVFDPPPAASLNTRLARLIDFANADPSAEPFVHPLVRAVILHFWLAYEHPYVDGNGRTARALFYWSMLKSGYWLFEFLTISRIIVAHPMRYYRSFLHSETDDNDLTYFLMNQLVVTKQALRDLHQRLREMRQQQERMHAVHLAAKLNGRQKALVDHALRHPTQIYTIESHQRSQVVSNETARTDLVNLTAHGLLVEIGGKRPRQFAPAQDLRKRLRLK